MEIYVIIGIIIGILGISFGIFNFIYWKISSKKEIQKIKEDKTQSVYKELKQKVEHQLSSSYDTLNNLQQSINRSFNNLNQINKEIETKKSFNSNLLKIREDELDRLIEEKKKEKIERLQREVDEWAKSAQEAADLRAEGIQELIEEEIQENRDILIEIQKEIEDYRAKREIINQEILRSRAIEEKQDFYRVQLSEESIRDISILNEIKPRLSKIDSLNKLIYDNYIKKPVDEMIKRVLEGRAPSGIYKITRLKTGEVYIGRSTDIKSRWSQHSKSAFHCGTISHSLLHTTIEKDGIENFVWELLEEVPKDRLNEREKYWIQFYGSQQYGLNEKAGG